MNPSARNGDGYTPLHIAAKFDKAEMVNYLIDKLKVNIDEKAGNKYRPIHCAAETGAIEAIKALIQHKPFFETGGFDSPENLAEQAGKPAAMREIKRYIRSGNMPQTESNVVQKTSSAVQVEVAHKKTQVPQDLLGETETTDSQTKTKDGPKIIRRRVKKQLPVKQKKQRKTKHRESKAKSRDVKSTATEEESEEENETETYEKTHTYEYETIEVPAKRRHKKKKLIKTKSKSKTYSKTKTGTINEEEEEYYYYYYSENEEEEESKTKESSGSYLDVSKSKTATQQQEEEEEHHEEEDHSNIIKPLKALKLRYDPNDYAEDFVAENKSDKAFFEDQLHIDEERVENVQQQQQQQVKSDPIKDLLMQRSLHNPLFELIDKNKFDEILEVVRNDESMVTATNSDGITPMYYAAMQGKFQVCEFLSRHGANVNDRDRNGRTAMHIAAIYGRTSLYHSLMTIGGRLDIQDKNGKTPNDIFKERRQVFEHFIGCCYHGYTDMASKDIDQYPSFVNEKDRAGLTGLIRALDQKHFDTFRMLLERGADVNTKISDGRTVLFYVVENDLVQWVQLLLNKGADVTVVDKKGATLLGAAIKTADKRLIELILKSHTQKTGRDQDGNTILQAAAKIGNYDLVNLFIDNGAEIDERGADGDTVLLTVARKTFPDARMTFRKILIAGADKNAQGSDGRTAMHLAAANGNKDFIQALIAADAQINLRDINRKTPLALAKDPVIIEYLKSKGAK